MYYIGNPVESDNIDIFETSMKTGVTRLATGNPEYEDPIDGSPNRQWSVAMSTEGSGRQLFMSGMEGVPPLTDLATTAIVSSVRNNGQRRFFQPYLIDQYGDRGSYQGQQVNACTTGPCSTLAIGGNGANDPNWNGMADPRWSPDGTSVVYWQAMVTPPSCGGVNPLPCETSTEPGGRTVRIS